MTSLDARRVHSFEGKIGFRRLSGAYIGNLGSKNKPINRVSSHQCPPIIGLISMGNFALLVLAGRCFRHAAGNLSKLSAGGALQVLTNRHEAHGVHDAVDVKQGFQDGARG